MNSKKARAKLIARAVVDSNSFTEAYLKTHPKSSRKSASLNVKRLWENPYVEEELDKLLQSKKAFAVTRENLVKILQDVVMSWYEGKSKAGDVIKSVELLSKLVPDFVTRSEIQTYTTMTDQELDSAIKIKLERFKNLN